MKEISILNANYIGMKNYAGSDAHYQAYISLPKATAWDMLLEAWLSYLKSVFKLNYIWEVIQDFIIEEHAKTSFIPFIFLISSNILGLG